jgi:DNA-binding MarR family transcriptional regulator
MLGNQDEQGVATERVPTPEELSEATRRLDVALADLHTAFARRLHLSQPELMAITHVGNAGALGPSELAHRIDVTTGAVTALVDRLAERGHLERRPHPDDRRRLLLAVTPHARQEVLRHVLPLADDVRALAQTFNDEERAAIGRFLDELTAIVDRHAEKGSTGGRATAPTAPSTDHTP